MVESSESLVASQEINQGSHAECGCKSAQFHIRLLPLFGSVEYFAVRKRHSGFCSNACKGESSQNKDLFVTEKY